METYTLQHLPPAYRRLSIAYFSDVANAAEIKKELVRSAQMEGPEGDAARRRMDFAFVEADVVSCRPPPSSLCPAYSRTPRPLESMVPSAERKRKDMRPAPRVLHRADTQVVSRLHLLTAVQTALLTSLPQAPSPSATPAGSSTSTPAPTPGGAAPAPAAALPASPPLKTKTHNIHSEVLLALNTNNNISDALRAYSVSDKTTRLLVVRIGPDSASGSPSESELYQHIAGIVQGTLSSLDALEAHADWKRVDKLYKLAELNQATRALSEPERLARKRTAVVGTVAVKPST